MSSKVDKAVGAAEKDMKELEMRNKWDRKERWKKGTGQNFFQRGVNVTKGVSVYPYAIENDTWSLWKLAETLLAKKTSVSILHPSYAIHLKAFIK